MYFEYLPSGISIGINDDIESRLVSLAKIPTVMAIYRLISEGKLKKDTQLTIRPQDINRDFGSAWQKGAGSQMTVQEAINLTLTESDNTTHNMLLGVLPRGDLDRVYNSLDIPLHTEEQHPVISPKNYSSILHSLFLSSYLPEQYSNEIIAILTKSKFR